MCYRPANKHQFSLSVRIFMALEFLRSRECIRTPLDWHAVGRLADSPRCCRRAPCVVCSLYTVQLQRSTLAWPKATWLQCSGPTRQPFSVQLFFLVFDCRMLCSCAAKINVACPFAFVHVDQNAAMLALARVYPILDCFRR